MSGWKPIETAPMFKDVLCSVTYNINDEEFDTSMWVDFQNSDGQWYWYSHRIDIPFRPTHWMPLPEPPHD